MTPQQRTRGRACAATLLAVTVCLAARPSAAAPAPVFDLDFVPPDAVAVVSVRVGALWANPLVKAAREKLGDDLPLLLREAEKQYGVKAGDVDRFTWIETSIQKSDGESVVISTRKPYDRKALVAAVAPGADEEKVGDRTFFHAKQGSSLVCIDERTFAVGPAAALQTYLKRPAPPNERALTAALKEGESHAILAAADAAAYVPALPPRNALPPEAAPCLALLKTRVGSVTFDMDDDLRAEARLTFANEADAGAGAGAAEAGLDLLREWFGEWRKGLGKDKDARPLSGPLAEVEAALKSAHAERVGQTVKASARLTVDAAKAADALADGARLFDKAVRRMRLAGRMSALVLGSINYADDHTGKMLPPAVLDKGGKPLLSWRVLVLPYVGEGDLYKEFHLDEPWDSEHNKKLLEKMPDVFAPPDSDAFKRHETYFQAFAGKGSVFDGNLNLFPASIPDGTSNTIMYAEAKKSVPWTKPEDIPFDGGNLLPRLGGLTGNAFVIGMCDGSARFFPLTMKNDDLHAWITSAGGEVVVDPDEP